MKNSFILDKIHIIIAATMLILTSLFLPASSAAQDRQTLSIETDPATFAFDGYAVHIRLTLPALPGWRFGAGTYAMDFPALLVDMNPDNKNQGWDVRLNSGIGLFTEYTPGGKSHGWFVGGQLALQDYQLGNPDSAAGQAEFKTLLMMLHTGYRWFPAGDHFYLQPWAGLGYTQKLDGSAKLGSKEYDIAPVIPFITVHVGYRF